MTNIILESSRAVVVGIILIGLIRKNNSHKLRAMKGWNSLLFGFGLIFLGTLVDITDNFPVLDRFVVIGDTPLQAFFEKIVGYLAGYVLLAVGIWRWLPKIIEHNRMIKTNLEKATEEVHVLQGLLPICASCKKIRDDKGYWNQIESYVGERSDADFTHSVCPECMEKLYPEIYPLLKSKIE